MPKIFLIYLLLSVFPAVSSLIPRLEDTNGRNTISFQAQTDKSTEEQHNNTNYLQLPQEGQASFYASRFHGRPTASGEPYDSTALTAAHRSLPFGTRVKVTNLRNNKSVVVRINDRGPHHRKRIIDVSKAAARKLDFVNRGLTQVRLEEAPE
jgi:rare lipoprotein A